MTTSLALDIVVVAILIVAATSGWQSGVLRSVFSAAGLVAGGIAAYLVLPQLSAWVPAPEWRIVIVVGGGLLLLALGQTVGMLIGSLLRRGVKAIKLSVLDRLAGLVVSAVAAALVLATVAGGAGSLGIAPLTQAVAGSTILGTIDRYTPDPVKSFLAGVRIATVDEALPWVLDTIAPPENLPPVADVDTGSPELTAAAASVVRVSGLAAECGVSSFGSGFVVSDDRVVTNAHVVAGVTEAVVEAPGEPPRTAYVVYFDEATDLAVLAVDGLDAPALPLGSPLDRGAGAAVQGYPLGGPFVSSPATVAEVTTIPRGDGGETREVYALSTVLEQGNSGGPLLDLTGAVAGVIFAKSAVTGGIGYALTLTELEPVAAVAPSLGDAVGSGSCAR